MAFIFQEHRLLPRLTALENLTLALQVADPQLPLRTIRRRAVEVLESLKTRVRAGSSLVFQDLQSLAGEHGMSIRDSQALMRAQRFLLPLPSHLPAPELDVDADGEVALDWVGTGGRM